MAIISSGPDRAARKSGVRNLGELERLASAEWNFSVALLGALHKPIILD